MSDAVWQENEASLRHEMRKAARDQYLHLLEHVKKLETYQFGQNVEQAVITADTPAVPLGAAITDFMAEHRQTGNWTSKTANKGLFRPRKQSFDTNTQSPPWHDQRRHSCPSKLVYSFTAPSWQHAWQEVIPFFAFPPEISSLSYTQNGSTVWAKLIQFRS